MLALPRRLNIATLALLLLSALSLAGQSTHPVAQPLPGPGTITLDGPWSFHLGDNLAWSAADFPDTPGQSGWEALSADMPWGRQSHRKYSGFAWYRRQLRFAPCAHPATLALLLPRIDDAYAVYWNGSFVAGFTQVPPTSSALLATADFPPDTYVLPGIAPAPDGTCTATLAIRVYRDPRLLVPSDAALGGFRSAPYVGNPQAIRDIAARLNAERSRANRFIEALQMLLLVVFLLSLAIGLRARNQPVLLWLASFSFAQLLQWFLHLSDFHLSVYHALVLAQIAWIFQNLAQIYLLYYILDLKQFPRITRLSRIFAGLNVVALCGYSIALVIEYRFGHPAWISRLGGTIDAVYYPLQLWPFFLTIRGLRRGLPLSSVAVALSTLLSLGITQITDFGEEIQRITSHPILPFQNSVLFTLGGSDFTISTIAVTLMLFSVVVAVGSMTVQAYRRQHALTLELQAARAVQQLLVPESFPTTPGFLIQAAYRAAGELGGDFFQILPRPDQSVLLVIGDVSGKGIPASLTVSLLLGTLTTVADTTFSPAKILSALNQTLLRRSTPGFTTALVLSISPRGTVTAASAGHLSPYRDGREMELDPGLPLGLSHDATYPESIFQLDSNNQITLLTDGIPEAMNPRHQLFGFDRTAQISTQSAEAIATSAQQWGQSDDITVLTLTRTT